MNRPLMILSGRETPDTLTAMEQAVIDRCREQGLDCLLIPHLYHLSDSSDLWEDLAARVGRCVLLCRLHPRPAEWILRRHGIAGRRLSILDLGGFSDAESAFAAALGAVRESGPREQGDGSTGRASGTQSQESVPREQGEGKSSSPGRMERFQEPVGRRWYPVVDGSRCVHCQHCLQFCLFGVYEQDDEGKVAVGNPDRCKPGCPACSRICSQSAIMFPLYEKDAAIAGAPGQLVTPDAAAADAFRGRSQSPGRPPFDDLDELVEQLDQRMQRRL
jgi:Pyruvate/2-oxoacid:ferredoxin oxidoreductase delta subunit